MPSTVLVSVSLLALVVTAHPILPELQQLDVSADVHTTVQAVLQSLADRLPHDVPLGRNDLRIGLISSYEQDQYLSQLEGTAIKAIIPLTSDGEQTDEEKKLRGILNKLDDIDGGYRFPSDMAGVVNFNGATDAEEAGAAHETTDVSRGPSDESISSSTSPKVTNSPILALVFACVAAAGILLMVAAVLFTTQYFRSVRSGVFTSSVAWEILPRLEKHENDSPSEPSQSFLINEKHSSYGAHSPSARNLGCRIAVAPHPTRSVSDEKQVIAQVEDDVCDDSESKHAYEDVSDGALVSPGSNSSVQLSYDLIETNPLPGDFDQPIPCLHELHPSSQNTQHVSSLGCENGSYTVDTETAIVGAHSQRDHRSAIPEFDIALAMQLRPGLGLGADPAWMVRFLMTIFGWFAVLLTGQN